MKTAACRLMKRSRPRSLFFSFSFLHYQDIALCYRSIAQNFYGHYCGGRDPIDYDVSKLFDKLEIEPNYEKMQYYLYLDMLF